MPNDILKATTERFLVELRHHLKGWLSKVQNDLSKRAFEKEIEDLTSDPVYGSFGLATPEYALIRMMGRMSISIGRRLGEIYDKMPRFVTQARFKLTAHEVAPKIDGRLELDVCLPLDRLTKVDRIHVEKVIASHFGQSHARTALAIEIRYNFNPNDSARLRKDVEMAKLLLERKMLPVYLIFSSISPRDEAIARLKRAGWNFLVGTAAAAFMVDLIGMNIEKMLSSEDVRKEVASEMALIMRTLYESDAMKATLSKYPNRVEPQANSL